MSDLNGRNADSMMETLRGLRADNAALRIRLDNMEALLRTTNNRFDALDTLLRHLQAATVGSGPSIRGADGD